MLKGSQKHEACKVLAQSPEPVLSPAKQLKNHIESPQSSFERAKNSLSDLNPLGDLAV